MPQCTGATLDPEPEGPRAIKEDAAAGNCTAVLHACRPSPNAYGFGGLGARSGLITVRAGAGGGSGCRAGEGRSGKDVETFPGGGEPSAVKSAFCWVSVFNAGEAGDADFFIEWLSP